MLYMIVNDFLGQNNDQTNYLSLFNHKINQLLTNVCEKFKKLILRCILSTEISCCFILIGL